MTDDGSDYVAAYLLHDYLRLMIPALLPHPAVLGVTATVLELHCSYGLESSDVEIID